MEVTDILRYLGILVGIAIALYLAWRIAIHLRYKAAQKRRREQEEQQRKEEARQRDEERRRREEEQKQLEEIRQRREEELRRHEEELRRREAEHLLELERRQHIRRYEPVRFHALWHQFIRPEVWETLLVYIFSGRQGFFGAKSDFMRRRSAPSESYDDSSAMARQQILRGTQISIYPEMNGFRFNPPVANVLWLEDWHCIEFRMQALPDMIRHLDKPIHGRIAFYVGPILIGETQLFSIVREESSDFDHYHSRPPLDDEFWEETWTSPYRAIFVSYSHEDSYIVDQLELAYLALGDEYLRDISVLRSGEIWNPALLAKISDANIFQLCWSEAAKQSQYVEEEWRYALSLRRRNFIRPMYWQIPMPAPPRELSKIQFAYVKISDDA